MESADGNITAKGSITYGDGVLGPGGLFIGKSLPASCGLYAYISNDDALSIAGWSNISNSVWVGADGSYGLVLHGNSITSDVDILVASDRTVKKDIEPLETARAASQGVAGDPGMGLPSVDGQEDMDIAVDDLASKYESVLDHMTPVRFRYKAEDDDAPYHLGYIAQDVEAAITAAGLDPIDMGTVHETVDKKGDKLLGIAYGELTALLHLKIKRQEERLAEQEKRIARLESIVTKLTGQGGV